MNILTFWCGYILCGCMHTNSFNPRKLEAWGDVRESIHFFMNNIPFFFSWAIKWRLFIFQWNLPTCCPLAKAAGRSKGRKVDLNSFKDQEQTHYRCTQIFQQNTTKLWFPQYLDIQWILSLCKTLENLLISTGICLTLLYILLLLLPILTCETRKNLHIFFDLTILQVKNVIEKMLW